MPFIWQYYLVAMNANRLYPINVSLANQKCLIAGCGKVGMRKLRSILDTEVKKIVICDPCLTADKIEKFSDPRIEWRARAAHEEDIGGSFLVFAATSSAVENSRIAKICAELNILCNCVNETSSGNFNVPAVIRRGQILITISTGGASPALSRIWKTRLEGIFDNKEKHAWLLGRLRRPVISMGFSQERNATIFQELCDPVLERYLADNDIDNCSLWLKTKLPENMHSMIEQIMEEYRNVFS